MIAARRRSYVPRRRPALGPICRSGAIYCGRPTLGPICRSEAPLLI